jgi:hypothetical protein
MYLVCIYICPIYGFIEETEYFIKKYIVTDAKNDIEAKRRVIEKVNLGIDETFEKIVEDRTRVIKLVNKNGIISL